MKTVYLAGGISGLSYAEVTSWRNIAYTNLTEAGFEVLDPMRGKEHLKDELYIKSTYEDDPTSNSKAIFTRDIGDIDKANILLVNLQNVSIGTIFEMGYAHAKNKPLIVVAKEELRNHPFIKEPSYIFEYLTEALHFIKKFPH